MDKSRPHVSGKWLFDGDDKFFVKSVGYGPFIPDKYKNAFPSSDQVFDDLRAISDRGFNTVRTFDLPPDHLVASASLLGLRLLVGVPWEQHTTFLDDSAAARAIRRSVFGAARLYAGEESVLGIVIGDRIPESIVRWHGHRKVEAFLRGLHAAVKDADPAALTTYVNDLYDGSIDLPFLDFHMLEISGSSSSDDVSSIREMHVRVGGSPIILTDAGIDGRLIGAERQASGLARFVGLAAEEACAGISFRTWSDDAMPDGRSNAREYGLVTSTRDPKPALFSVSRALREESAPALEKKPFVSVVVPTHNGARTISETLAHLRRLDYPCYEILVVDDGSSDDTWSIAKDFGVRTVSSDEAGEAAARNTGVKHAAGDIVAFVADDAYPDRDWLTFLVRAFVETSSAAVAGPCIAPTGDGLVSLCTAQAPGQTAPALESEMPAHLLDCSNIAFDRLVFKKIGLFDTRFSAGSSEVDLLWRIVSSGEKITYCAGALVWRHAEQSIGSYWKRQFDHGKAEALLEQHHPDHFAWRGNAKSSFPTFASAVAGTAFDEPRDPVRPAPAHEKDAISPEWVMSAGLLGLISLIGLAWWPLLFALPLFLGALVLPVIRAVGRASSVTFPNSVNTTRPALIWMKTLTTYLYLVQPVARLAGRTTYGLTAWRHRDLRKYGTVTQELWKTWTARTRTAGDWLDVIEKGLEDSGALTARGDRASGWDLHVRGGLLAGTRLKLAVEEHGAGKNLLRLKYWPRYSPFLASVMVSLAILVTIAALGHAAVAAGLTAVVAIALASVAMFESSRSAGAVASVLATVTLDEQRFFESRVASTFDAPVKLGKVQVAPGDAKTKGGDGASQPAIPVSNASTEVRRREPASV